MSTTPCANKEIRRGAPSQHDMRGKRQVRGGDGTNSDIAEGEGVRQLGDPSSSSKQHRCCLPSGELMGSFAQ